MRPGLSRVGTAIATIVVIAAGLVPALPMVGPEKRLPLVAVAVLYALVTFADGIMSSAPLAARRAWFTLAVVLAGAMVVLSHGTAVISTMPVISHLVLSGSTARATALSGLLLALFGALELTQHPPGRDSATDLVSAGAAMTFVIVFSRVVRAERLARADGERLAGELETANAQLREYAALAENIATANERNRIAREIHDGLGHCLTVVNVQLEAARALGPSNPERSAECVLRAQAMTQRGLDEIRQSVAVLREPNRKTLVAALSELVEECGAGGLNVSLSVRGEVFTLSAPVHTTLYRAAQEGLTNVRRHANTDSAVLELEFAPSAAKLRITDDGDGTTKAEGGFGLLGLRERVELLGGTVEVTTSPSRGFALTITVPT